MTRRLIQNDIRQNKLLSAATLFFMAISAMLLSLTVLLSVTLFNAVDSLMDEAAVPDYMQMHAGEADLAAVERFAASRAEIKKWQITRFLNLDNSQLTLAGTSLADSTQDNGLCVQGSSFDYLLDTENQQPQVQPGSVYVPVCYRAQYDLQTGDLMEIGGWQLQIAGFLRDAQMNSMMASSKRFLVTSADYEAILASETARRRAQEEYLIEFLLQDGADTNALAAAYAAAGLPANGPAITRPLVRMMNALSDGTTILILFLASLLILLISLLCIRFMLLLQIERDQKEIGMLKALGVAKKEIRRLYTAKYLLLSLCGAALGLLGACAAGSLLANQLQELYGSGRAPLLSALLPPLAAAAAEALLLLSVRHSLKKTEKQTTLQALLAPPAPQTASGQYFIISLLTAACTLLALLPQNLYSTMSAPEFVTYMGIGNSEIRIDVRQTEEIDAVTEQIARALEQDPQVERYAVLRTQTFPAMLPDQTTVNLNIETGDHSTFPVHYSQGSPPASQTELALSAMNAEELGLSVGGTLPLIIDGQKINYTVCGIYSDITNGGKTAKRASAPTPGFTASTEPVTPAPGFTAPTEPVAPAPGFTAPTEPVAPAPGFTTPAGSAWLPPVQTASASAAPTMWSVLYVSLTESTSREAWIEQYRQYNADITDIASYITSTYGQTLKQLRLASGLATAVASAVIAAVVMLFLRLIVEKNRRTLSLHKALGFTSVDLKRRYFAKGLLPVLVGLIAGIAIGNLFGESLCGIALKTLGAESFRFVIAWRYVLIVIPAALLCPAIPAILAGTAEIRSIKAYECCQGRE